MSRHVPTMDDDAWVPHLVLPVVAALGIRLGWSLLGRTIGALVRGSLILRSRIRALHTGCSAGTASPAHSTRWARLASVFTPAYHGVLRRRGPQGRPDIHLDLVQLLILAALVTNALYHAFHLALSFPGSAAWSWLSLLLGSGQGLGVRLTLQRLRTNLFLATGLPVHATPPDLRLHVRDMLMPASLGLPHSNDLSTVGRASLALVEPLLRRASSFEGRRAYLLLGPNAFACDFCRPLMHRKDQSAFEPGWSDLILYSLVVSRLARVMLQAWIFFGTTLEASTINVLDRAFGAVAPLNYAKHGIRSLLLFFWPYSPTSWPEPLGSRQESRGQRRASHRITRRAYRYLSLALVLCTFLYRAVMTLYLGTYRTSGPNILYSVCRSAPSA